MKHSQNKRYYSSHQPSRSRRGVVARHRSINLEARHILFLSLFICASFFILRPGGSNGSTASDTEVLAAAEIKQPEKIKPKLVDEVLLASTINALIKENPRLDIGVAIQDIENDKSYTYGVENPFIAASVSKILTATLYLKQVEAGQRTLDDELGGATARVHIQNMLAKSDNTAWKTVNDELTKPALEAFARERGLAFYDAETNKITTSEVNLLLSDLYKRKILNEDNTRFLLANMQQDQEEIQFIRKYVDPSVAVYHKAGWLADRAHDTAIIENGDRPFTLVIFTKARNGTYDFQQGQTLFSEFTTAVMPLMKT